MYFHLYNFISELLAINVIFINNKIKEISGPSHEY